MQPPPPPDAPDTWPTPESATVVANRETLVDTPPPAAPPPADRRIGWGMLLGLGVLALVALGILIAWLLTHRHDSKQTTTVVVTSTSRPQKQVAAKAVVPAVTGRPQAAAIAALESYGFTAHAVTVPSAQPKGTVTAQSPAPGASRAKGTAVRLNVSAGAPAGSTTPATTTTTAATTTTTAAATTTAPQPTTTAAQAPPQPTTASVPDVTGSKLQPAVQQLDGAGFLASIQYIPGTDPLGTIEQQSPTGGGSAKTRSHVTINASSGPGQKTEETVPDATGQTLRQAVSTMNGAHLRLIYEKVPVTDRSQAGKVVAQTPLASKQAPENAQILVYLGAFKQG